MDEPSIIMNTDTETAKKKRNDDLRKLKLIALSE
jgi:hypothetical protein